MHAPSTWTVLCLLAGLALGAPARAQVSLASNGGGTLGKVTTMSVSGAPGSQYLLFVSLNGGPTPLPPPHTPGTLDVGFDLLTLSVTLPGFLGVLPPSGEMNLPLPLPPSPLLDPLALHFQAVRITTSLIDGKSHPWILTPAFPGTSETTLNGMSVRRAGFAVVPEPGGTLLYFGGGADGLVASYGQTSVDRYDPATQTFTALPPMLHARTSLTATRLLDGRILLAGGADDLLGEPVNTAEVYDPATGVSVNAGPLASKRALHGAARLPDGRVLITGGTTSFNSALDITTNALKTTEIFNPATNTFSAGPDMSEPRVGHTTTTLNDGKLLCAGGFSWFTLIVKVPFVTDSAQIYTPVAGMKGSFGSPKTMYRERFGHAAVLLPSGDVLLAGGAADSSIPLVPAADDTVEIYSPSTGTFQFDGFLTVARSATTAAVLPDGSIVIAGGAYGSLTVPTPDNTIDVYSPGFGVITMAFMTHVRANFTAATLPDGTVLLAGGGEEFDPQMPSFPLSFDDAEIFHP